MSLSRRNFLKLAGVTAAGGVAGAGTLGYAWTVEPNRLVTERVTVGLKGLPSVLEGFRIVQLSDLHLYPFTGLELISRAVRTANALEPDLIVLTGDYVLSDINAILDLAPTLAKLNANYGVYGIYGNHDLWFPRARDVMEEGFKRANIPLLKNSGAYIPVGEQGLYVAGLDDAMSGEPDLSAGLQDCPADAPVVLLAHEPDFASENAQGLGGRSALQLSGHTHGGQVRLPGRGAIILPEMGRKYDAGLFQVGAMQLYVNRGVGVITALSWTPPVRFNCPPEVTEVTLVGA